MSYDEYYCDTRCIAPDRDVLNVPRQNLSDVFRWNYPALLLPRQQEVPITTVKRKVPLEEINSTIGTATTLGCRKRRV